MNTNNNTNCPNRIKPPLLRDQKTEALLIFIRTTLEQYFEDIEDGKAHFDIGTQDDRELIEKTLRKLLEQLQDCVVNSTYIRSIISTSKINHAMKLIAKKEEPVMVYYDSIISQLKLSLLQGQNWIPEQLVICLLSEWIIEEEKSVTLYPFLNDINYIELLEKYELANKKAKEEKNWDKSSAILNMYRVGNELINRLKSTVYKVSPKRVSKTRKKRR